MTSSLSKQLTAYPNNDQSATKSFSGNKPTSKASNKWLEIFHLISPQNSATEQISTRFGPTSKNSARQP
ncbi:hypothetical protein DPMN_065894 [Dreissena polymorpha]|uniref:Uncharacterized protein n=1 Tax=Dreissena polymorpha TaxID=45954 RepID=A0A9D3YUD7_DREPO|nr:hypothetical protein DPMN_065894 [Dreissena polymorpha]